MTLGEFRAITEHYDDKCPLFWYGGTTNLCDAVRVDRVLIDIRENTTDQSDRYPNIIVS